MPALFSMRRLYHYAQKLRLHNISNPKFLLGITGGGRKQGALWSM